MQRSITRPLSIPFTHPIGVGTLCGIAVGCSGLPMGWMIGSIVGVGVVNLKKRNATVAQPIHPIWKWVAQVALAVQIGQQFNATLFKKIWSGGAFKGILITLCLFLVLSVLIGWLFSKWTRTSLVTSLLAVCPGGVSVIPVLSSEWGADSFIVSTVQLLRAVFIACVVPTLATLISSPHQLPDTLSMIREPLNETLIYEKLEFFRGQPVLWTLLLILSACVGFVLISYFTRHSSLLLGSILGAGTLQYLCSAYAGFSLHAWMPEWVMISTQILIGSYLGSTFYIKRVEGWKRVLLASGAILLLLMTLTIGCAWVMHRFVALPLDTALLAIAPGGLAVMTATALSLHSQASLVAVMQTIRLLLILVILSVASKWMKKKPTI